MKTSVLSFLIFFVTILALSDAFYINYYDEVAPMFCAANQYMYQIRSIHHNKYEDRRWEFYCRSGTTSNCAWSGYVNNFDDLLTYICPGNKVVTGIYSYHSNHHEDRRFNFRCCNVVGKTTSNCYLTDFLNDWDGTLFIRAEVGYAIKGAISEHNNGKEDRRWKFYLCKLS